MGRGFRLRSAAAMIEAPLRALVVCMLVACGGAKTEPGRGAPTSSPASPPPIAAAAPAVDIEALENSPAPEDRMRAVALREQACAAGEIKSCVELANALMTGAFVERDPWRAAELRAAACEGGNGDACSALADQYDSDTNTGEPRAKIQSLWTRACELEEVWACDKLSNAQRAFDIERARCERGDASACFSAELFRTRGEVNGDIANETWQRLRKRLEPECDNGIARSCLDLSSVLGRSSGGQRVDPKVQRGLELKACDLGYASACRQIYGEKDAAVLEKLARRGCELGDADSCLRLGEVSSDPDQRLDVLRRSCALGSSGGCQQAASLLRKAGDSTGERTLSSRRCALDNSRLCLELARADEASGDRTGAVLHFARACAFGMLTDGCAAELRIVHATCSAGDPRSCDRKAKRLAQLHASKRGIVAWLCCHAADALPDTPAAAVIALATAVLATEPSRLRALVHPKLGLSLQAESSFDGEVKSRATKLRAANVTPQDLTSVVYEIHDAIECGEIKDGQATCTISDPIGFAATYTIAIEGARAYVIAITAQSWGHS